MPIFEYRCPDCRESFETLRAAVERDKPIECAACGSTGARRKLSVFSSKVETSAGEMRPQTGGCGFDASVGACARPGCRRMSAH